MPITRPIVLKIGGAPIEEPSKHSKLWDAIAGLHRARAGRLVIVHGGGAAIDDRLRRMGMEPIKRDGIRVTPREQIGEVVAVLRGIANAALVGALCARGCRAVGLCLGDGGLTRAEISKRFLFDPGLVGDITGGDPSVVRSLLAGGMLPVIAPIAFDSGGGPLNVNADDAAAAVARIIGAESLVLLTDVPGVMDGDGKVIAQLDEAGAAALTERGVIRGGMIPKVRGGFEAARASGTATIIAGWGDGVTFTALAEGRAVGTRLVVG
ncbi:MAG TPA: acetylglutamate kinase [Phycisphaerales bacterium]|nr:acetylglutamate kinase [Phycisphaerales bacterium]